MLKYDILVYITPTKGVITILDNHSKGFQGHVQILFKYYPKTL